MPKTRKTRSRESSSSSRSKKGGGVPLNPNYTGADPQFGNISDLPKGVKRQTAILTLQDLNTGKKTWSRLTFRFPECVGIAETLNNAAKKGECIPTLSMNVQILVPVVKNFRIDVIRAPPDYTVTPKVINEGTPKETPKFLTQDVKPTKLAFILTGDDQLTTTVPDIDDEDKTVTAKHAEVIASISNAIYAKYWDNPDAPAQVAEMAKHLNDAAHKDKGGFETAAINGDVENPPKIAAKVYANSYMNAYLQMCRAQTANPHYQVIDNILEKGHTLTSDHVNLFIWNNYEVTATSDGAKDLRPRYWVIRTTLDYTTKTVSLSSLLLWKRQLKEFLPKQIQWRMLEQAKDVKKNQWEIALSRGSIKESGVGDDPASKTDFPDIDEEKFKPGDEED